jgi:uncharacterized protein
MKIAILSDIHDNLWKLDVALTSVTECAEMICCGDLCSPFVIDELARGFPGPIHIVFGNNDADLFRITAKTQRFPNVRLYGEFCDIELAEKRFAVNHFDFLARPIAQSGRYDVVCFGHNHEFEITQYGPTLALNPGSILGAKFRKGREDCDSTFLIYDSDANAARLYKVDLANDGSIELNLPRSVRADL